MEVNGFVRTRPKIVGHLRFNGVGGFDPNYPWRTLNRVFECSEPTVWKGQNKVFCKSMLHRPERPDYFLVVVRPEQTGRLEVGARGWKSDNTLLISFSECREQQEAMLLMPAYSWLKTALGLFVFEPCSAKPWTGQLRLAAGG